MIAVIATAELKIVHELVVDVCLLHIGENNADTDVDKSLWKS